MGLSLGHLLVVLLVVLVVFGAGKLPSVMGDLGKGLRSFKAGLRGDKSDAEEDIAAMITKSDIKPDKQEDKKDEKQG